MSWNCTECGRKASQIDYLERQVDSLERTISNLERANETLEYDLHRAETALREAREWGTS